MYAAGAEGRVVKYSFSTPIDPRNPPIRATLSCCDFLDEITVGIPCGEIRGRWFEVKEISVNRGFATIEVSYHKHDKTKTLDVEYTSADPALPAAPRTPSPAAAQLASAVGGGGGSGAAARRARQDFSISVANLVKLIRHVESLPDFRGQGRDLTSNDLREFLRRQGKTARDVFGQFFTPQAAVAVLTYEWALRLRDICTFLNGPTIRQHNVRTQSRIPDDPERLTVWIDVLQLDQNSPDMQGQLVQSEAEYEGADEHIILGTSTVCTRAWCIYEAATRARAGRRSHVLKSLRCEAEPRFDVAAFVASTRGLFYEEMRATMPADLALIRRRIDQTYGSPDSFNGALLSIFQDAA
jgi:hypothetical protein